MKWSVAILAGLVLAGCGAEPASMQIDGPDQSLTVERIRPYFWSENWELKLIVRRNPECQRRHSLKATVVNGVRVDVYRPEPGVYILRQGKRWYVTELKSCEFQAFKEAPPEPGELLGSFRDRGGAFRFVPAEGGKDEKAAEGG